MAFDKNNTSTGMKVVIVIFSVILVVSLCLPFFSSCSSAPVVVESADGTAEEVVTSTGATTVAGIRSQYAPIINNLEGKLKADPENTTAMASLGNNYMDMASSMTGASDYAGNEDAATEAYLSAVKYYDMYLERADSQAVTVDRAVCRFYAGEQAEAISDLEAYVERGGSDYAMAWFNLGVMYYTTGDFKTAATTFGKAVELDPDGSMGVAGNASLYQMISEAMLESEEEAAAADATTDGGYEIVVSDAEPVPAEPAAATEAEPAAATEAAPAAATEASK